MTPEQPKTEKIQARHNFTDAEIREIAVRMAGVAQEYSQTESEFTSIKADFKAKLERIDLERDTLVQRIRDGFEMRPATAYVRLDYPEKGRKTYYRDYNSGGDAYPEEWLSPIREEAMTFADQQRELPLTDDELAEKAGVTDAKIEGLAEQAQDQPSERHAEIGDTARELEKTKDVLTTAAQPIGTSFADKLAVAAAGKTLPMVEVDFAEGYAPAHYVAKFRKKAKMQSWPEPAIQLIDDLCQATADGDVSVEAGVRVQQVLRAHSVPVPTKNAVRTAGATAMSELPPIRMQINSVSMDSQERFMTEFESAANEAQWTEAAIETVGNILRENTTVTEMHEAVKGYLAK